MVHFPRELLPTHIIRLLDKLKSDGITCTYRTLLEESPIPDNNLARIRQAILNQQDGELNPQDKESFRIVHFGNQADAMEWVATQEFSNDTLFINGDNKSFDHMQRLFGNPLSGSQLNDANPDLVQLFKLGCSLFISPLNIYNLLSYLQIYPHPLPIMLRRKLGNKPITEGELVYELTYYQPQFEQYCVLALFEKT